MRESHGRSASKVGERVPFRVQPMLAKLVDKPFDKPGWVYEEKYDGYRLLAYKEDGRVTLMSRNALDRTKNYPEVATAIAKLKPKTLLLDGEVVVFDKVKVSRFQLLQQGAGRRVYATFDCLYVNGEDLRREPLAQRRAELEKVVGTDGALLLSRRLARNGMEASAVARKRGFEGMVAKDAGSPYVEGRSAYWLKVKVAHEDEFVIAGYTAPDGSCQYFGALLLGTYQNGKLLYLGRVGAGFDPKTLGSLHAKFAPLAKDKTEVADPPRERGVTYLAPRLVAQISYKELTADRNLRQPVFLGLRDDKDPKQVGMPEAA